VVQQGEVAMAVQHATQSLVKEAQVATGNSSPLLLLLLLLDCRVPGEGRESARSEAAVMEEARGQGVETPWCTCVFGFTAIRCQCTLAPVWLSGAADCSPRGGGTPRLSSGTVVPTSAKPRTEGATDQVSVVSVCLCVCASAVWAL